MVEPVETTSRVVEPVETTSRVVEPVETTATKAATPAVVVQVDDNRTKTLVNSADLVHMDDNDSPAEPDAM